MRYSLRNKHKIEQAYGKSMLERIIQSLDKHFTGLNELGERRIEGDRYDVIFVADAGHTVNDIVFYVTGKKYDVVNLAFKEFIG